MKIGWPLATKSALLTLLMAAGPMAAAQTGRPWVDPPGEGAAAPAQAPEPQAPEPVRPVPAAPPQATETSRPKFNRRPTTISPRIITSSIWRRIRMGTVGWEGVA